MLSNDLREAHIKAFDFTIVILNRTYIFISRHNPKLHRSKSKSLNKRMLKSILQGISVFLIPVFFIKVLYIKKKYSKIDFKGSASSHRIRFDQTSKSFVFFAPIDWGYRVQRPQNLAAYLAKKGYDVFYINPTIYPRNKSVGEVEVEKIDGVSVCTIYSNSRTNAFYIGTASAEIHLIDTFAMLIENLLTTKSYSSTKMVVQQPGWWPYIKGLVGNQVVFDCMDYHEGFKEIGKAIRENEDNLDQSSDTIVVSSQHLLARKLISCGSKSFLVRNGVNLQLFRNTRPLPAQKQIVIGYFGAVAEWFDVDLVAHIAKTNPLYKIEIIGAVTSNINIEKLQDCINVFFMGEIDNVLLPKKIVDWTAGLIPFKVTELISATNPVKMYEYAAAGIPIVSTAIPEVAMVAASVNGIFASSTYSDFNLNLSKAIAMNSFERQDLVRWSENQSWSARVVQFESATNSSPKVSIIVLMWNHGLLTLRCLKSIYERSDYSNIEIIVIDNNSDQTEADIVTTWLESMPRGIFSYTRNSENLGFASGNNVGIRLATGEYIVILNNDTEVTPGWIWRSLKHFYRNPELGLLGPSTNNCGNEARITLRKGQDNWLDEVVPRFNFRESRLIDVHTVAFFCVFIPKRVIEEVGLISEDYGRGYFEDDDYCRRVENLGLKVAIARDIFVYHQMGASFDLMANSEKKQLFEMNKQVFESKWGKWVPHTYSIDADQ